MAEPKVYIAEYDPIPPKKDEPENESKKTTSPEDELNIDDEEEEQTLSAAEIEAREQGWTPKEEWKGDPAKWVDVNEFLYRGQLMSRIQSQTKTLKNMESKIEAITKAYDELSEHNKKISKVEYERALRSLKAQKAQALEAEAHDQIVEIDDQISELKNAQKEADAETKKGDVTSTAQTNEPSETYKSWVAKNEWYENDDFLQVVAEGIATKMLQKDPATPEEEVLAHVAKTVRKEFPHKFESEGNARRSTSSVVTTTDGDGTPRTRKKTNSNKSKYTIKDLNDEQRSVAKTFVEMGTFKNVQEYVDQLAITGELD